MRCFSSCLVATFLLTFVSSASAKAAKITYIYNIDASGFGSGAPIDPIKAVFTVNFDPAVSVSNITNGITATGLELIDLGSKLGYTYDASSRIMRIGGVDKDVYFVATETNDFGIILSNADLIDGVTIPYFVYSNNNRVWISSKSDVSAKIGSPEVTAPVPEPATYAMMIGGLGIAGLARRRRVSAQSKLA